MKKIIILLSLVALILGQTAFAATKMKNEPDSVYLFSYATKKNMGHNGLHFAWSIDRKNWNAIGPELRYLFCDYGRWGAEKRMLTPFLFRDLGGLWHCIWSLNEKDGVFAHAASSDLVNWHPQSYPIAVAGKNCMMPEAFFDKKSGLYVISWISSTGNGSESYSVTTKDFKTYTPAKPIAADSRPDLRENVKVEGNIETGTIQKVSWHLLDGLLKKQQLDAYKKQVNNEGAKDDAERFASLKPLEATVIANVDNNKKISDMLTGIFFEDINYAADGGLYAELIQNRDFEYALNDKEGNDKSWNSYKAWSLNGSEAQFVIDTVSPVHKNNKHYAVLKINKVGAGLVNDGFDGIPMVKGDKYDLSVFVRNLDKQSKKVVFRLIGKNGDIYGETTISVNAVVWKKNNAVIIANTTASDARLEVVPQSTGSIALDMVSLFPQKTFKGHKNGLRADLAQAIADIHPRFMRFPGGCVSHGDGLGNIYRWKNTIGPLEARVPQRNLWGYHQSAGLGYFEYFQFCEDIGAQPVPVIAAGVPCQNSATGGAGQQGGVPMCDMDQYVQDILDLIEYANGDVNTKWGKMRAEAGHSKPFNLKYVGIGNEDLITDIFEERFAMIFKAIKERHPEITVIGTVGPASEGTDYVEGWNIATKLGVPVVDEHYYQPVGWFINNQDFYDKYDRSKPKVYLGEYASWGNSLYNALAEALYLTALERNGDVVSMASYAPMLAKEGHTQWNPDLIYFNNTEVKPTVNYYVQKLYGQNSGDVYLAGSLKLTNNADNVQKRVAYSVVRDSKTDDLILKLVNLLPVMVNAQVNLEGAGTINSSAIKTVLTGIPGDKTARPVTDKITVNNNFSYSMPAYSFTVIRLKTK
ncbi:MAG: alpha-L-arabinofuranosidase C-terminal domain-containing protein [Bacteroidota bacterium]|nr:alpha-L-arabinofuranosidase C-terminal domain-containing protein [Bacteroidota bacterium]